MSLATALQNQLEGLKGAPAEISGPIIEANNNLKSSFDTSGVIKVGEVLPPFSLSDATGKTITTSDLLKQKSLLLVSFYRGSWCPFCNLALQALQKRVDDYRAEGAEFVAISPELPDGSLSLTEKHDLKFPVLSDPGLNYARQLGIVFKQDEKVNDPFSKLGISLSETNGNDSNELPIPITLLIDQDRVVKNVYLDTDFTKRLEPSEALRWIEEANGKK